MANGLFNDLQKAIDEGNIEEIARIRQLLVKGDYDEVSESLINSIKGKYIYKSLCRICDGVEDFSRNDYIKVVSSLITHSVIECSIKNVSLSNSCVMDIYVLLGNLINDSEGAENNVKEFIKEKYGKFLL